MKLRRIAAVIQLAMIITGFYLVYERGGILAWAGVFVGAALILKSLLKPSKRDLAFSLIGALIWASAWIGTFFYVISTWETGEFIKLSIDTESGTHQARVWVLDINAKTVLYYDAEPEIANALLHNPRISVERNAQTLQITNIDVRAVDEVPDLEIDEVFAAMATKYEERNGATDVFYSYLGRSRDRVAVLISLTVANQ